MKSTDDEIRDNLASSFGLAKRPELDHETPSHSHLRVDAAVNNVRDAIVAAEQMAARMGLPSAGAISTVRTDVIGKESVAAEMTDVRIYLAKLRTEIRRPEIRQIGLININIGQIDIKTQIASFIANADSIDLRGLGTAAAGIARLLNVAISALSSLARAIRRPAETILNQAARFASKMFDVIRKAANRVFGETNPDKSEPDRIWTESEVQGLILSGESIPADAAPYVRTLSIGERYDNAFSGVDLMGLARLTELRRVQVYAKAALDANALEKMAQLEFLEIQAREAIDLSRLANLPNLRAVRIHGFYGQRHTASLPPSVNWPRLEDFYAYGVKMPVLPDLGASPNLRRAVLDRVECNTADLSGLRNARVLKLENMILADLNFIDAYPSLEELDVRRCAISNFQALERHPTLVRLKISRSVAERMVLKRIPARVEITGDHGGRIRPARKS